MVDIYGLKVLVTRAVQGDSSAVDQLLQQIRPYLHLIARQRVENEPRLAGEDSDLVQETLLRIHRGLQGEEARFQGENPQQFLAWIRTIARRVIVDHQRRGLVRAKNLHRLWETKIVSSLSEQRPLDELQRMERVTILATALENLPEQQRDIVIRRIFDRMSYEEISRETGQPAGTLRVYLARAIATLRMVPQLRTLWERPADD